MKISSKMLKAAMLSGLALVVGGCATSRDVFAPSCKPVAPVLEWYENGQGGIYYPERSVTNLMLYIEQLNDCIDYYQVNPG
ncbi:hypothetical protein P3488_10460 [Vibrio parahaemolyticus]|nr:hypothetical protein [Vibrio parahaemolyticus]